LIIKEDPRRDYMEMMLVSVQPNVPGSVHVKIGKQLVQKIVTPRT
jgi:hypothetical protein